MHARIVTLDVRPGSLPEVARIYENGVLPLCRGQQGFRGALLLSEADTGQALSITLWESEPDMRAGENSEHLRAQADRLSQYLDGSGTQAYYRVEASDFPSMDSAG